MDINVERGTKMLKTEYVVGVDVGGTKIATGLMNTNGKIIDQTIVPTEAEKGPRSVINRIIDTTYQVIEKSNIMKKNVRALGIGVPGPLNTKKGLVKNPPNLPYWDNVPIVKILEKEFKLPIIMENDANAATIAEYLFGKGKGLDNFIYITVSTGIGGGIITDGKLFKGESGNAVEIGHMTINFKGPQCGCGNYGCWEAYASGSALAGFAKEGIASGKKTLIKELAGKNSISAEHVFAAALQGDTFAKELVEKEGFYLGVGLANIINTFNPKLISIGGGLSNAWDMFYEKMICVVNSLALKANNEDVRIVKASLGKNVGLVGACAIALDS